MKLEKEPVRNMIVPYVQVVQSALDFQLLLNDRNLSEKHSNL